MLPKNIDLSRGELSRRNTSFEKQIELSIGSTRWLRDTEVGINDGNEAETCPEESGIE